MICQTSHAVFIYILHSTQTRVVFLFFFSRLQHIEIHTLVQSIYNTGLSSCSLGIWKLFIFCPSLTHVLCKRRTNSWTIWCLEWDNLEWIHSKTLLNVQRWTFHMNNHMIHVFLRHFTCICLTFSFHIWFSHMMNLFTDRAWDFHFSLVTVTHDLLIPFSSHHVLLTWSCSLCQLNSYVQFHVHTMKCTFRLFA